MIDISSGAAGIVVGFALKFGADYWSTARAEQRQDLVWRREHLTDSAATLLAACVDATKANGHVVRCVEELTNAESSRRPTAQVMPYRKALNEAYENARLAAEVVDRSVQAVLLYAHNEVEAAAIELVRVTKEHPTFREVIGGPFHNQEAADVFRRAVSDNT